MAARMVARAMTPLMAANPPVAKPTVARIMAAMMVVAVRTTATARCLKGPVGKPQEEGMMSTKVSFFQYETKV
jgi:hypothetical protein